MSLAVGVLGPIAEASAVSPAAAHATVASAHADLLHQAAAVAAVAKATSTVPPKPKPKPKPKAKPKKLSAHAIGWAQVKTHHWSYAQYTCLDKLWTRESDWKAHESNGGSGAYGIPQSLPGRKMATFGRDWRDNPTTQIKWGLWYIADRYGTPCAAWAHSQRHNWY